VVGYGLDADRIVRALATADAPFDSEHGGCRLCDGGGFATLIHADLHEALDIHDEVCPWRLAREYVAQKEGKE